MMMKNMFSIFDPSSSYMSLNWLIVLIPMCFTKMKTMKLSTKTKQAFNQTSIFIYKEINQMMEKKTNFTDVTMMTVLSIILMVNVMAIFPYNFTVTAHISISFTLSVTLWLSTILFGWLNQFKHMIIHLTPLGTPNSLMNFMVMIETISTTIRPITLSIRLSANMVAGHLLMSLLSSFSMNSVGSAFSVSLPMALLILLEIGVAMVQAYVFMTLMLLYQNETC